MKYNSSIRISHDLDGEELNYVSTHACIQMEKSGVTHRHTGALLATSDIAAAAAARDSVHDY
jgi:hypothetical protein